MKGLDKIFTVYDAREFWTRNRLSFKKESDYINFIDVLDNFKKDTCVPNDVLESIDDLIDDVELDCYGLNKPSYKFKKLRLKKKIN